MPDEQTTGTGGTGGSTDTGATGQTQTTGTGQTAASTTTTGQTAAGTSSQASGQTASPTAYTYKEDRSDWVPRHRLNEVSQKAQTYEERLAERDRQIAALTGAQTPDPNAQKAEAIREAFFNLPGMGVLRRFSELSEEQIESILQVPQQFSASKQAEARQWERHGNQQVDTVAERVAEAIGADSLDAEQKADLRTSMSHFIASRARTELQQAADRYGEQAVARDQRRFSETIRRYEDGDPKLLDEFVTRYTKNWVEPARRSATARTSTRTRPVPASGGRTPVTSSVQRPEKFNNWDERLDFAVNLAKERGVQFGR
jgi:hypothetical protein